MLRKLLAFLAVGASFSLAVAQEKSEGKPVIPESFKLHLESVGQGGDAIFAQQVFIPAKDRGFFGRELDIKLEATVYKPTGAGPFPVIILNHGSTGNGAVAASLTYQWQWMGRFFSDRGIVSIAPMRRGRGRSDGNDRASEPWGNCNQLGGVDNAVQDLDATIAYARTLPYVDSSRIFMMGVSRGGILSLIYAARRPDVPIQGVVNFVGGWANYLCYGVNEALFQEAGEKMKIPSLWIYGTGDLNYSDDAVLSYRQVFEKGNSRAIFKLYSNIPGDGHRVPQYSHLWSSELDGFMKTLGIVNLRAK